MTNKGKVNEMGKAGGPRDAAAWQEKREIAKRLLGRGVPSPMIARQLGASKSWIQRIQQEMRDSAPPERESAAS
ncbi:MAG: hypothetical protein ACR2JC_11445 [Chloroflexota bacterium]